MSVVSGQAVRVAILNDCEIVNAGVDALLAEHRERVQIVELPAGTAEQVDVVLFDPLTPVADRRVDVASLARRTGARLVAFTWASDDELALEELLPETCAHISKTLSAGQIVDALEAVRNGRAAPRARPALEALAIGLTPRESEVLQLITRGLSNQEMADHIYLSINSVKTYIRTAYRKIGVNSRSQAVSWGLSHGLGTEPAAAASPPQLTAPVSRA